MNRKQNFIAGFVKDNPVFSLYLGICSTLAISTSIDNAIGMGISVTIVLIFSNMIISALRKITPSEIRIPVYIVIIATLVKVIEMLLRAYMPGLYDALGMFIALIVVNCVILGRAESFASKNGVFDSALDGLGVGLGYTFSLLLVSIVREILTTMSITLSNPLTSEVIFKLEFVALQGFKIPLFGSSVGAFLTFACFAALFSVLKQHAISKETKEIK